MNLTLAEKIMYATLQINMLDSNGNIVGRASGFVFAFCVDKVDGQSVYALVTNRHVLGECSMVQVIFTTADSSGKPIPKNFLPISIPTDCAIFHPDSDIDLAVLPLGPVFTALQQLGHKPFCTHLDMTIIPSEEKWGDFDAVEDVIMVGYPKGLRDISNNLPIFRRGITATHPGYNYLDKPQFLMDMACFPGSSGSPVFLLNEGTYVDKRMNSITLGSRVYLLGIQYAVPNIKEHGDIEIVQTGNAKIVPVTQTYINLGYAIKSTQLLAFESIIADRLSNG